MSSIQSYYKSANKDFTLVEGDCVSVLESFDFKFDMIFADPPYFLSNGGISVSNGKVVCVDKGKWDKKYDIFRKTSRLGFRGGSGWQSKKSGNISVSLE